MDPSSKGPPQTPDQGKMRSQLLRPPETPKESVVIPRSLLGAGRLADRQLEALRPVCLRLP